MATSLKDILDGMFETFWRGEIDITYEAEPPTIEDWHDLSSGIGNLLFEIGNHSDANSMKVTYSLVDSKHKINMAWNNAQITEEDLKKINERYKKGALADRKPQIHGTKIAGYFINKYNGTIKIEKTDDPIYNLQNIITFQLAKRISK